MDQDLSSISSQSKNELIKVNLDDFNISEDSFRPMTKGLGFHQESKKSTFKAAPKEAKVFSNPRQSLSSTTNLKSLSVENTNTVKNNLPSGLEAFYQNTPSATDLKNEIVQPSISTLSKVSQESMLFENVKTSQDASSMGQLAAWLIDVLVIASFVGITGALLVVASGIQFSMYSKIVSNEDLAIFTASIFSIYYLLYFTILDLSSSPGKTIMGLKLVRIDQKELSVKQTFSRALVSLLSGIALFLPMILDFQGRLSETKVVK